MSLVPRHDALSPRASGGFTLLEVLVALAIVAIALIVSITAMGNIARQSEALHERLLAGWSAENRMAQAKLAHEWPELGSQRYACPQGNLEFSCVQTVSATPNPTFRRLEIRVELATGKEALADFVTLLANETERPL